MKLPFLTHSKSLDQSSSPWPWPGCANIKTLSFRASDPNDTTFNSAFLHTQFTPAGSFLTFPPSISDLIVVSDDLNDPVESVIRSLRSDRLFFDLDHSCSLVSMANGVDDKGFLGVKDKETRIANDDNLMSTQSLPLSRDSIQKQEENNENNKEKRIATDKVKCMQTLSLSRKCRKKEEEIKDVKENKEVYKESEILSIESNNPYEDYRRSMEEMVEALELKEWQGLEELLDCYLKINGDENHGYIVGAFIDLLVSLSISSTISTPISSISSSSNVTSSSSFDDDGESG